MSFKKWLAYMIQCDELRKQEPEVMDILLSSPHPSTALDRYYSSNEEDEIQVLLKQRNDLRNKVNEKQEEIEELKQKYSQFTYTEPEELTKNGTNTNYDGVRIIPTKPEIKLRNELNQDEYFHPTQRLKNTAKKYGVADNDSDYKKFDKCLKAVQEEYDYIHDDEQYGIYEHFSLSFEVAETGKDDCESLALTAIDMYLACNGDPEKIYWCAGHVVKNGNSYGHGWIGFRKENGEWYIGEATHPIYKAPEKWKDSYQADWGISNPLGGMYRFKEKEKPWKKTKSIAISKKDTDKTEKDKVIKQIWDIDE